MPKMKVPFSVCWGPFWLTDLVVVYSVEGELLSSLESPVLVPCCHDQIASWWHHLPFNTWGQDFNVCMDGHKNSDLYNWNNSSQLGVENKRDKIIISYHSGFFFNYKCLFLFCFHACTFDISLHLNTCLLCLLQACVCPLRYNLYLILQF